MDLDWGVIPYNFEVNSSYSGMTGRWDWYQHRPDGDYNYARHPYCPTNDGLTPSSYSGNHPSSCNNWAMEESTMLWEGSTVILTVDIPGQRITFRKEGQSDYFTVMHYSINFTGTTPNGVAVAYSGYNSSDGMTIYDRPPVTERFPTVEHVNRATSVMCVKEGTTGPNALLRFQIMAKQLELICSTDTGLSRLQAILELSPVIMQSKHAGN